MKQKWLFWSGSVATIIYIMAVLIGAAIRPGYSHLANFISELMEAGAPNTALLNPLFLIYNVLVGVFAYGMFVFTRDHSQPASLKRLGATAAWVLVVEAIFGFVTVFFPQDIRGTEMTSTGTMHIILAGLSSFATMIPMLLLGLWFNKYGMKGLSLYTFISLAVVFISGGITAALTPSNFAYVGLLERITIGGFLQWMLVLGILLPRKD